MKRSLFTLFLIVFFAAGLLHASDSRISVSLENRPVYELFDILKQKGGLSIVYSKEQLYSANRPVTINISLANTKADTILEISSKAAGFSYEEFHVKEGVVYVVLPVDNSSNGKPAHNSGPEKTNRKKPVKEKSRTSRQHEKPEQTKEKPKEESEDVIDLTPESPAINRKRYTGNFMYGHGSKIYLNLLIPVVDPETCNNIKSHMEKALHDGFIDRNEAVWLFSPESDIGGTNIDVFLEALSTAVSSALEDDTLSVTEVNRLRNSFINRIVNEYKDK